MAQGTARVIAPTPGDLAAMEASLIMLGEGYRGMAAELFATFIAAHPHHAAAFMNPEAAQERMTRETLEAMLGLAAGEAWVAPAVTNFVDLHRNYGTFSGHDYETWLALVIAAMEQRAGKVWLGEWRGAWERQAARLTRLVAEELAHEWAHKSSV